MPNIKAIETVYNGYRFRSRLEARWAVFFDELGIKYEYEFEGYCVKGENYLPDFWVNFTEDEKEFCKFKNPGFFIEIKPNKDLSIKEKRLLSSLHKQTHHRSYFFCGVPGKHKVYTSEGEEIKHGFYPGDATMLEMRDMGFYDGELFTELQRSCDVLCLILHQCIPPASFLKICRSAEKASMARFEHGEKGGL